MHVTVEEKCHLLQAVNGIIQLDEVQALSSNQEEADTKFILCCRHAEESGNKYLYIFTVDSDTTINCLHFAEKLKLNNYVQVGTKASKRILDIGAIQESV